MVIIRSRLEQSAIKLIKGATMLTPEIKAYSDLLNKMEIDHKIVEHPELKTPAEVQAYLGLSLAEGVSTMIMKADDRYIAILRRDDCRLDFNKIKALVGKKVRMASPDEFTELTGMPLGAARVFNTGLITYIDDKLLEKEYLTGGSGSFTCSIRYKAEDLKKIPNSMVVSISQQSH